MRGLALAVVAVLALSGCGAQEDVSFTCGPEEEPRECGWWETRRARAAFDEVEEKYRATSDIADHMRMNPVEEHDTSQLRDFLADPFLTQVLHLQDEYREQGVRLDGKIPVISIDPVSFSDDSLVMAACVDSSEVAVRKIENNELIEYGDVVRMEVHAAAHGEEWKIASVEQVSATPCKNS